MYLGGGGRTQKGEVQGGFHSDFIFWKINIGKLLSTNVVQFQDPAFNRGNCLLWRQTCQCIKTSKHLGLPSHIFSRDMQWTAKCCLIMCSKYLCLIRAYLILVQRKYFKNSEEIYRNLLNPFWNLAVLAKRTNGYLSFIFSSVAILCLCCEYNEGFCSQNKSAFPKLPH